MLSSKKPAQIPVFIAFFPLTTNSTAKSRLKKQWNKRRYFITKFGFDALMKKRQPVYTDCLFFIIF